MADNDLLIKINADAKNAQAAFDNIRGKTEDLEETLNKVTKVGAVAFAVFTAEIFLSVKASEEAERASVQLTQALQNQGIYTDELANSYRDYADAVQAATGIDNDAVIEAQAVAQTYLKQTEITKDLTFAIADLSASMGGDLNGAAEKIARSIGTSTNAFARQGLVLADTLTEAERAAKVLEFVQQRAGGLAAEFNKADGFTKALATSFGNLQEAIGAKFAPVIAGVRQAFITIFDTISNNPVLTDLAVAFIAAGAGVAGLVTAITVAIPAFLALSAAVEAFGIASSVAFVGIPLLIGAIIAGITLLALNWDKSLNFMKAAAVGFTTLITELFSGLGKVLSGAFDLDPAKIKDGLDQVRGAYSKARADELKSSQELTAAKAQELTVQNADKKAAADKEAAIERQHQLNLRNIRTSEIDLLKLQNDNASAQLIALKTKEIETLKALDSQKSAAEIAQFRERLEIIRALQDTQQADDLQRQQDFLTIQQEAKAELIASGANLEEELSAERLANIQANLQVEEDVDRQIQENILKRRIDTQNQMLLEQKKFGTAYAVINKALQSEEVKGVTSATQDLIQLQQSKNQTLKAIGKAAAVTNIAVATAESAMNIFRGFSTIPIVGPALGVAGAAAAVAFGAERTSQVLAAADGGLMTGGTPGRDSIPTMTMPGELVVPTKNFEEVVGAVQSSRGGGSSSEVIDAINSLGDKIANVAPSISIAGDFFGEESLIDKLVDGVSNALEFRNKRIFGVNT